MWPYCVCCEAQTVLRNIPLPVNSVWWFSVVVPGTKLGRAKFSYRAHSAKYTAYPKSTMDLCSHFIGQTTVANGPPARNNSLKLLT